MPNSTFPTNGTAPNNGTAPAGSDAADVTVPSPVPFFSPSPSTAGLPDIGPGPSPFSPSTSYMNGTGVDPKVSSTMQFSEIFYGISLLVTVFVFAFFIKKTWKKRSSPMVYSAVDEDEEDKENGAECKDREYNDIELT